MDHPLFFLFYIISFVSSIATLVVGMLIFIRGVKRTTFIYFLSLSLSTVIWGLATALYYYNILEPYRSLQVTTMFFSGMCMSVSFLHFSFWIFEEKNKSFYTRKRRALISLPAILMLLAIAVNPGLFGSPVSLDSVNIFAIDKGSFVSLFVFVLAFYMVFSLVVLIKKYTESAGIYKTRFRFVVSYAIFAVCVSIVTNVLLPFYLQIYILYWFGPLVLAVSITVVAFEMLFFYGWNMRLFLVELFVTCIVLTMIVQASLFSTVLTKIINTIITGLILLVSYFLLKSVKNETVIKKKTEKLVEELEGINEKLKSLDRKKSDFMTIASHHLRDPLTAIKGYASMLIEGSYGDNITVDAYVAIRKIYESSERLVVIVNDFMTVSNIESGDVEYIYSIEDINVLVAAVCDEMNIAIESSGLSFSCVVDSAKKSMVKVDIGKIRQVFSNLIDNALKYTKEGFVKVEVVQGGKDDKVQVKISDSGIGMSKATMNELFKKFSRAEGISKINTGGSGLGLYVAREMAKEHMGDIYAESEGKGKGSTFIIELPLVKEED